MKSESYYTVDLFPNIEIFDPLFHSSLSGGDDFLSSILSSLPDLSPVLDHLLSVLDPSASEDMDQDTGIGELHNT